MCPKVVKSSYFPDYELDSQSVYSLVLFSCLILPANDRKAKQAMLTLMPGRES